MTLDTTVVGTPTVTLTDNTGEVDITPYVRHFEWKESYIDGGWSWCIEIKTDDIPKFEPLVFGSQSNPVSLALGFVSDRRSELKRSRRAYTNNSAGNYYGRGMRAQVTGGDIRIIMTREQKTRAWLGMRASDVFRDIAFDYELGIDIDTSAIVDDNWQLRMNDWEFMKQLNAGTTLASGRGDAYLYVRDDVLQYKAPDLAANSSRRYDIYAGDPRILSLSFTFNGEDVLRNGGRDVVASAFEYSTGSTIVYEFNATSRNTDPDLAAHDPRRVRNGRYHRTVTCDTIESAEETARSIAGKMSAKYHAVVLEVRFDLGVEPGMIIDVDATVPANSGVSAAAVDPDLYNSTLGRYVVLEVIHTVVPAANSAGTTTTIVAYRKNSHFDDGGSASSNYAPNNNTDDPAYVKPDSLNQMITRTPELL